MYEFQMSSNQGATVQLAFQAQTEGAISEMTVIEAAR